VLEPPTSSEPIAAVPTAPDFAEIVRLATLRGKLADEEKKATRKVKAEYYVQLKDLFRKHQVPFMTAAYEAEQAGSWLVKNGFANVIVSDDYDCLLCGAPSFFQHFHSNKKFCTQRLVHLAPLLKHLNFTHAQFIDFCILTGTDFGGHLPGIGIDRAR
jgi:flap endonuclease-1